MYLDALQVSFLDLTILQGDLPDEKSFDLRILLITTIS